MQILDVIIPVPELPESAPKLVFVILAIGLIPVSEGVDFIGFDYNSAVYFAAVGEIDRSIAQEPMLSVLADDPGYPAIRARMLANFNANREVLSLPPYDENFQVMANPD
jgi:hypothetical protein